MFIRIRDVHIRLLNLSDSSDFAHYCRAVSALYVELFGEEAAPTTALFDRIRLDSQRTAVRHWAFAAFAHADEEELYALATVAESFATFAGGAYLILAEFWVADSERNRGVGAEFIEFLKTFSREEGYDRIDVTAPTDPKWDRTYAFYQKNGFVPTGRKLKLLCNSKL